MEVGTRHYKRLFVVAAYVLFVGMSLSCNCINGQSICGITVSELMKCKPAVTAPNPAPPTSGCCSALSHANMACLCTYKNSSLLPSLGIDPNLAIHLPQKCKLPNPKC